MAAYIFTSKMFKGERIPVFNNGEMMRDFTYIDDIVKGVIACLDNPPADEDGSACRTVSTTSATIIPKS